MDLNIEVQIVKNLRNVEYIETTIDGEPIRIVEESSDWLSLLIVVGLGAILVIAIIALICIILKNKKGGGIGRVTSASMRRSQSSTTSSSSSLCKKLSCFKCSCRKKEISSF